MSDLVSRIWDQASRGVDMRTAEGRAAVDRTLKAALARIPDQGERQHAASLLRDRRWGAFRRQGHSARDLAAIAARVDLLERLVAELRAGHTP